MFVFSTSLLSHTAAFHSTNSVSFVLDAHSIRFFLGSPNAFSSVNMRCLLRIIYGCLRVRAMLFKTFNNFIHSLFSIASNFFQLIFFFSFPFNANHPLFQSHGLSKLGVLFFAFIVLVVVEFNRTHEQHFNPLFIAQIRNLRFCVMAFFFVSIRPHNIYRC